MTVSHLEVMVEEPSMEVALQELLPKVLLGITFQIYPFQCKTDLVSKLPSRMRAYSRFLPADYRILVVVDQDDDNCTRLKAHLNRVAADAGLTTRTINPDPNVYKVVNRIAIEELEAWYFGDWTAVRTAYPRVPHTIPNKAKYRNSDAIFGGTWEALERVLKDHGYFANGLRKIELARSVAPHMEPPKNRSASFACFHNVLAELAAQAPIGDGVQ